MKETFGDLMENRGVTRLIDRLGDAPKPKPVIPETPPEGYVPCACRKKYIPVGKLRISNTKFLQGVTDSVCDECWPDVKSLIGIVCIRCRAVVARMQPYTFSSGFALRKGETYHTEKCPNCDEACKSGNVPLVIIERRFYERMMKK